MSAQTQNFKNHSRYHPVWHIATGLSVLALLAGSIINLVNTTKSNLYSASLLVLVALILCSIFWFARAFALKAQDRAIRAEEKLRYYILTGKSMDAHISIGQIIALRFAEDGEFPGLVQKTLNENLSPKEIKTAIRNWKADHYRV